MDPQKLLRIYIQDHLAAGTVVANLARRTAGSNRGTTYGDALSGLAAEIDADRSALGAIAAALDVSPDRPKSLFAWTAERAGRLKLNGQLTGYSPLSRVVELEGLSVGITGNLSLWRALSELAASEPRLDREQLGGLVERAESQLATVEELRARAARDAFMA